MTGLAELKEAEKIDREILCTKMRPKIVEGRYRLRGRRKDRIIPRKRTTDRVDEETKTKVHYRLPFKSG